MNKITKVPGLHEAITKILNQQLSEAQARLQKVEQAQNSFKNVTNQWVTFEVTLYSLWADEGEHNITSRSTRGLKQAIKQAQARFKKTNNRNDLQVKYSVRVCFAQGAGIDNHWWVKIPESLYSHLK